MKQNSLFLVLCLFVVVGVPRLFSLDAHWSGDETIWLKRSAEFINAVQTGQFNQTLIAHHPGVSTMWIAGLRQAFGEDSVWLSFKDLALARWFIGIVVWSGLVATFFLLHRIFAFWAANFAWGFLVINPFFLAQSRRVHTDALATVFILLAVLLFVRYCVRPKQDRYLILSGIAFGLACLSKSYSLILLLWVPVCLLLFRQREQAWRHFFAHTVFSVVLFLNCSLLTVFMSWPIFWTPLWGLRGLCLLGTTCLLTLGKKRLQSVLTVTACAALVAVGFFCCENAWACLFRD